MNKRVKIGLVGIGEIAQVHARGYAGQEQVEVAAVCGTRPINARKLASEYGMAVYDSYQELLGDPSVQAVDICVPNHLHREFSVQAMRAGKHVLCEKPIALTAEDGQAMIDEAAHNGVFLMVGHVLRYWPEVRMARDAILAGRLGRPLLASGRRLVSLLAGTQGAQGWRHDPDRCGGAVIDMQIHDIDFFCWLFGQPTSVYCQGMHSADGGLNHVLTTLAFPGGEKAFIEASFMMPGNPLDISFHILGERGSVEYAYKPGVMLLHGLGTRAAGGAESSLVLYQAGRDPEPLYTPPEDSFVIAMQRQLLYFTDCVREGRVLDASAVSESLLSLKIALAARQSAEQGSVIYF